MQLLNTLPLRFRSFAGRHDNLPAFHAGFLLCTLVVAALFNLGAFAALILGHVTLDIIKYRDYHKLSWAKTIEGTVRENLVDVTLLLTALTFTVYFHHSAGFLAAAEGIMRAEITVARAIFVIVPKFTILHNVLCILSNLQHYYETLHPRLGVKLQPVERCYLLCAGMTALFLLLAPVLLHLSTQQYAAMLLEELTPGLG